MDNGSARLKECRDRVADRIRERGNADDYISKILTDAAGTEFAGAVSLILMDMKRSALDEIITGEPEDLLANRERARTLDLVHRQLFEAPVLVAALKEAKNEANPDPNNFFYEME